MLKALRKDPDQRYATAHDLLEALETAMPGCLEASFESEVQQFLQALLGERAAKRKAALKSAQEQLDKPAAETGSSPNASARPWLHEAGTGSAPAFVLGTGSAPGLPPGTGSNSALPLPSSSTQLAAEIPARPKLLVSLAGLATRARARGRDPRHRAAVRIAHVERLDAFQPLLTHSISAVSSLDGNDLSLFVRSDSGKLQVAYKGAPLYLSAADMKPGDRLGIEDGVWSLVNP